MLYTITQSIRYLYACKRCCSCQPKFTDALLLRIVHITKLIRQASTVMMLLPNTAYVHYLKSLGCTVCNCVNNRAQTGVLMTDTRWDVGTCSAKRGGRKLDK